jgi:hypothetical protein
MAVCGVCVVRVVVFAQVSDTGFDDASCWFRDYNSSSFLTGFDACGGGGTGGVDDDCVDLDSGATDPYGDGCMAYNSNPGWCGGYDDSDFSSSEMCCGCGGGSTGGVGDDGDDEPCPLSVAQVERSTYDAPVVDTSFRKARNAKP